MSAKRNAGFTLIELVVVIAIVAVLANIIALNVNKALAKTRDRQRLADMHTLQLAFNQYAIDHDGWMPGLSVGVVNTGNKIGVGEPIDALLKPYMNRVPRDPLNDGVVYYYAYDPAHNIGPPPACTASGGHAVMAVETFETMSSATFVNATCSGPDEKMNLSYYNVAVGPTGR